MSATAVTAFPLLSAKLTHDYYGGPFGALAARSLPATARLCARLGLRLTGGDGTLTLRALPGIVEQPVASAWLATLEAHTMCWELAPADPNFAAFTGVDFNGSDRVLVLAPHMVGAEGGRLTATTKAGAGDVWTRQPLRFGFRPSRRLAAGSTVILQTAAGANLRSYPIVDPQLVNVDTSDFGSGLYQLAQGRSVLVRWFADERALLPPARGPLLVLPGALLAAAVARPVSTSPPVYTAALPARSVVWRYHVFNAASATGLSIEADDSDAVRTARRSAGAGNTTRFHLLPAPVVPGAISFEATRALPLAEQSPQRFVLSRDGTALCSPLPVAGFDFARPAVGAAPCSDIFVHLQPQ